MKQIVENILQRLGEKCPTLQHIEKDCGQLSAEQAPAQWPCAFIDLREASYTPAREGYQSTEARIAVILADRAAGRDEAGVLRIFNAIDEVSDALQGWVPAEQLSPLNRAALKRRYFKHTDYEVYRLEFTLRYGEKF